MKRPIGTVLPTRLALRSGLMIAAALATVSANAPPAPDGLDLAGVHLGMALQAWKALKFPGATSARVGPVCSDEPAVATDRLLPAATDLKAGVVICGYLSRYGRFRLPQTINLGPTLQARHLRFTFVSGRLSSIEYRASVDAFDDITARLTARFGPPNKLARDSVRTELGAFPRVREIWSTSRGQIELVDPVPPYTDLSVRLGAPGQPLRRAS